MYYGQRYEAVLSAVDYDDIQNIPDFQYDTFTGPGTSFTLTTGSPKDVAALDVTISGVTQKPGVDYSVTNLASGTQIAFSSSLEAGETAVVVYRAIPGSSQTLAYTEQFTAVQNDNSPVLGGDLNLNENKIISATNTDLKIEVGAGGELKLNEQTFPSADGVSGQFLMTDGSAGFAFTNIREGSVYYTNGNFGTVGDSKSGKYIYRGLTTDDVQTEIFIGGVVDSRLDFQNNSINTVDILVTGAKTATLGGASFKFEACFKNTAGALTLIGTVNKTRIGFTDNTYDVVLDADIDETNTMRLRCTGAINHIIRWMAVVNTVEVSQ